MKNIWISGSINSGKTTVAKILSKKLKMAVVELDSFSEYVENFLSFEEYLALNYEVFHEIVTIYNKRNIAVIIVYPLSEKKYLEIKNKLDDFKIFTIDPGLDIALQNRGDRKLTDWEIERIKYHYSQNIHNNYFSNRIDTAKISPEDTANKIIEIYENQK
jgi:tRNA uridine 5-carbamoylmethylation protein Kti12